MKTSTPIILPLLHEVIKLCLLRPLAAKVTYCEYVKNITQNKQHIVSETASLWTAITKAYVQGQEELFHTSETTITWAVTKQGGKVIFIRHKQQKKEENLSHLVL